MSIYCVFIGSFVVRLMIEGGCCKIVNWILFDVGFVILVEIDN